MAELDSPTRLSALRASGLLDRTQDERLKHLVEVCTYLLGTTGSELNVITEHHQVFIATWPHFCPDRVDLTQSACQLVVRDAAPVAISDATRHPLLSQFKIVADGRFRSYLGVPVYHQGEAIGSLCTLDDKPRKWGAFEINSLRGLARLAGLSVGADLASEHERTEQGRPADPRR